MGQDKVAWSGPIVQAVDRIYRIRNEIRQLEMEETVLRDAVLSALEEVDESAFPLRLGNHDVRVQFRSGRIDEDSAVSVLTAAGLESELVKTGEIVGTEQLLQLEESLRTATMPAKSRDALQSAYRSAIRYRMRVDLDRLKALRTGGMIDEESYQGCFRDRKSVVRALSIR